MMVARTASTPVITVGFAAGRCGEGIAYASIAGADGRAASLVRVVFRCRPLPALCGRDVAYAAVETLAVELFRRGRRSLDLHVDDTALTADLIERRAVPAALTIPYVRLRCTLNRFDEATVAVASDRTTRDLTARARVEASLTIAA